MQTAYRHTTTDDPAPPPAWVPWLPGPVRRRFLNSPALRKISSNASWLMLERLVNMSIQFFVGVWFVRYLGPEQFGLYSYALSFVALFSALAHLGLDQIVVRNLAEETPSAGETLATALTLRITAALAVYGLVAIIVLEAQDDRLTQVAVLILAGQLVFQSATVLDQWFQAQLLSKYAVWARSSVTVLISGTQVLFILLELPLVTFVILLLAQSMLNALGFFLAYRKVGPKPMAWRPRLRVAKAMLRDAWPMTMAALSVSVFMKIDQVMLAEMAGHEAVGIYAVAVKVSEVWYFIPMALAASALPELVRTRIHRPEVYQSRLQMLYDTMALLSYGIAVPMTFLAAPLVQVLFGATYAASAPILQIHIWALLFMSTGIALGKWLVAENLTVAAMAIMALGAIVNVGLNAVLIPHYAGVGAAWATLLSYAVATYFSCLLLRRLRPAFAQLTRSFLAPIRLLSTHVRPSR